VVLSLLSPKFPKFPKSASKLTDPLVVPPVSPNADQFPSPPPFTSALLLSWPPPNASHPPAFAVAAKGAGAGAGAGEGEGAGAGASQFRKSAVGIAATVGFGCSRLVDVTLVFGLSLVDEAAFLLSSFLLARSSASFLSRAACSGSEYHSFFTYFSEIHSLSFCWLWLLTGSRTRDRPSWYFARKSLFEFAFPLALTNSTSSIVKSQREILLMR